MITVQLVSYHTWLEDECYSIAGWNPPVSYAMPKAVWYGDRAAMLDWLSKHDPTVRAFHNGFFEVQRSLAIDVGPWPDIVYVKFGETPNDLPCPAFELRATP